MALIGFSCQEQTSGTLSDYPPAEIFYHVVQRSFYDSNGDRHGDLAGLEQQLDYLQELGITSILLLPLYESEYYHNYFPTSFKVIDREFGTEAEYLSLVRAVHERGMKLYMDMEIQYVTEDHLWFKDSYQNPTSPYSKYILYNGPGNTDPESIIFNLTSLEGYDGTTRKVATLNLYEPAVKRYLFDLFAYWVDPNQDGNFEDGVDGFRIDHMMDDLDEKGIITGMFSQFWKPLFDTLRSINPAIRIMGEQANWFVHDPAYFSQADLDYLFAFAIKFGISSLEKRQIENKVDSTLRFTPSGKNQLVFIENHDTDRFASKVVGHPGRLRIGAALNLLLPGIPILYYGQELGMKGAGGFGKYGMTDANDIPRREAFEWFRTVQGKGMALWYQDSGPWWEDSELRTADGISAEEQMQDPESLWHFYRNLISYRKENPALSQGDLRFLSNESEAVISFVRNSQKQSVLVLINLSEQPETVHISKTSLPDVDKLQIGPWIGQVEWEDQGDTFRIQIQALGIQVNLLD